MAICFKKLIIALGIFLVSSSALAHGCHSHGAPASGVEQEVSERVSDNNQVRNRVPTDQDSMWQPVYPYLASGELDPVFKKKTEKNRSEAAGQIKVYYCISYTANIGTIDTESGVMEFHAGNQVASCKCNHVGYEVLNYKSGKKDIWCLFGCKAANSKAPEYVQLNNHTIASRKSSHFHAFMENTPWTALLEEMENWPTYYPYQSKGEEVVDEMLHH